MDKNREVIQERTGVRIHPTAEVSAEAVIGEGTSIWHQAQVRERARIGRNCILGKGVYVDFDVTLGDNCKLQNGVSVYHPATVEDGVFLGPGVIVTNDRRPRAVNPDMSLKSDADWEVSPVWIGQGAAIGAGSVLLPGVKVGRWAMVGAGSVVTKDVPDYALVLGSPARQAGYVCPCGTTLVQETPDDYCCSQCGRCFRFDRAGGKLTPVQS
ncbi:MAG: N-acetyltransferase [Chloroflexi bacterium]|nr:N-acetyltransferase [Chloroflexota bacterium]MCI0645246.1 N-acetyltransferase [Chloroflexota bacterium]MCI0725318.1 N-acetyltransferase [Chloroflexota bacterium]